MVVGVMGLRDPWWRVVVYSKYGSLWGRWCSLEPVGAFGVRVWKKIRKGWDSFSSLTRFVVGGWNQDQLLA